MNIDRLFPCLCWPRPTRVSLKRDAYAGISVGLVLIPQSIAYATLAGMPPETGLYAALLPAVIGILWGSSALLATGPVALSSLLVAGSLQPMAVQGSYLWVALAVWLSIYAGIIQMLLGIFRLGIVVNLFSHPVAVGFVTAAALIIVGAMLPSFLSLSGISVADFSSLSHVQFYGPLTLLVLVSMKRLTPKLPGILIMTTLGICLSWWFDFASIGGSVVGQVPRGLPSIALPGEVRMDQHLALLPAAIVIALVSFTEAMSSGRMLSRKVGSRWDANQELIGQGLAKIASGVSGAFPVSGSFSRSAMNHFSGAVSGWASLFAAACVSICLLFLTDVIYYLPRPVLAATVIASVLPLIKPAAFRDLFSCSWGDGIVAMFTFIATLFMSPKIHWGVLAGVTLTVALYFYRHVQPRIIEVAPHPDGTFRDRQRFNLPPLAADLLAVRIDATLDFLTGSALEKFIEEQCARKTAIRRVLLCIGSVNGIDSSGVETLRSLHQLLEEKGRVLYLSAPKKQVWEILEKSRVLELVGLTRVFLTDREAFNAI